jgi:hypothetical protein
MDLALLPGDISLDAQYEEIRQLAAGNPTTDSSIAPKDGSCPWKLLPRGLRDEILRYAYGRNSSGLKIRFKAQCVDHRYEYSSNVSWAIHLANRSPSA